MRNRYKLRWWEKPAGPLWYMVMMAACGAALAIVLSGCSVDTTRPDYEVRLFESNEDIRRRHDLRMQDIRNKHRRTHERFRARHGMP